MKSSFPDWFVHRPPEDVLVDIFWSRKVIFSDILMCLFHEIGPIMCKMVFGGFCLVDTSYQKTEKSTSWKSYELKVLQILIRSIIPTSSYGWTKYSIFNVTEYRLAKSWKAKKSHFWYSDFLAICNKMLTLAPSFASWRKKGGSEKICHRVI